MIKLPAKYFLFLLFFFFMIPALLWADEAESSFKKIRKHFVKAQVLLQEDELDRAAGEIEKIRKFLEERKSQAEGRACHALKNNVRALNRVARDVRNSGPKTHKQDRIEHISRNTNLALSTYLCKKVEGLTCSPKQCRTPDHVYQVILSEKDKDSCEQQVSPVWTATVVP
ncbi:MAG: hypothetical protein EXS63_05750 [Candidatus Omnitrophica bacterium]|nr:hypothetical protein [Candidatus Omnitrophota bacterium]